MKVLIAYFSVSGTTRTVVEEVTSTVRDEGYEVDLHAIGEGAAPDVADYAVLGVGSPTHFFRPPEPVRQFIGQLPELRGLPFFTIVLHGTVIGDAGNQIRKWLGTKGGRDSGYFSTKGKDLWLGYLRRGQLFSPDSPTAEGLQAARTFAQELIQRLKSGQYAAEGLPASRDPSPTLVYRAERLTVHPWIVRNLYSRMFRATDACTGCGECVAACPTSNVSLAADMRPLWGQGCILCLNCELRCPEDAVRSAVDLAVMAPFMRYNISKALADPTIESAPAQLRGGTVRRLD